MELKILNNNGLKVIKQSGFSMQIVMTFIPVAPFTNMV